MRDIGQLHRPARYLLDSFGQVDNLFAGTFQGWGDPRASESAQRIEGDMRFRSLVPLGPALAGACAGLRCRLQVRLSRHTTVGWSLRPPNSRSSDCTSATSCSKHPAGRQPTLHLLIHRSPWLKIVRHVMPLVAGLHEC
jgi:hypothetical protein